MGKTNAKTSRIAISEVKEILHGSGQRADALRAVGMRALVDVKRAKLVQSRRERARVAERHGENSDQAAAIDRKMAVEHNFLVNTRAEYDRISAPEVKKEADVWQLHGYLRDQDGFPRARYTVGVFPDQEGGQPAVVSTTTNAKGYFHVRWKPQARGEKTVPSPAKPAPAERGDDGSGKKSGAVESEQIPASEDRSFTLAWPELVYLGGKGAGQSAPTMDTRPLHPRPGGIDYRDLTVFNESDQGSQCQFATRLLGNSATHELHNLDKEKPGCRLAAMRPDHRVYFMSEAQAAELGYDFCAHCYGRKRSQR